MKLRFYAAGDTLVSLRDVEGRSLPVPSRGVPARYIGREYDAAVRGYPATKEAFECEDGTGLAEHCKKNVRCGDLLCADEATAAACGVSFAPMNFKDGVHVPAPAKASKGSS